MSAQPAGKHRVRTGAVSAKTNARPYDTSVPADRVASPRTDWQTDFRGPGGCAGAMDGLRVRARAGKPPPLPTPPPARVRPDHPLLLIPPTKTPRKTGTAMAVARPLTVEAAPYPFSFDIADTALVLIDMQRDFLEPGGFGESLGNDVSRLRRTIAPLRAVLAACRAAGMTVIHTREGHLPDLSDCPPSKLLRGSPSMRIGDPGPKGRILVRGEEGHDIIEELYPVPGEPVIDKPGKGAFHATGFGDLLTTRGIRTLVVTGVTTEVCVHTTVREANDRGYECLVLSDCVGSYFPEFQRAALAMITAQGGIFGWTAESAAFLGALSLADAPADPAVPRAAP